MSKSVFSLNRHFVWNDLDGLNITMRKENPLLFCLQSSFQHPFFYYNISLHLNAVPLHLKCIQMHHHFSAHCVKCVWIHNLIHKDIHSHAVARLKTSATATAVEAAKATAFIWITLTWVIKRKRRCEHIEYRRATHKRWSQIYHQEVWTKSHATTSKLIFNAKCSIFWLLKCKKFVKTF